MSDAYDRPNSDDFASLANAYLDGNLDSKIDARDRARFEERLANDPAAAREFARLSLLHDALDRELTAGVVGRLDARSDARSDTRSHARSDARKSAGFSGIRRRVLVAAVMTLAAGLAWVLVSTPREASASDALARIVEALRSGDRTYILRAIEGDDRMRRREAPLPAKMKRPPAPIDGAIVSLRGPSSFVLVRRDEAGREVISGSDGIHAWIVPADGPVRVSRDPSRFRGALPGGRLDLPFIDPHADLSTLARSYDIVVQKPAPAAGRLDARLVATRRADVRGGPKEIEIDFDPKTSLVRAIRLENLPQAQGGPRAVEFELVDDAPLGADYFTHEAHHTFDRPVLHED